MSTSSSSAGAPTLGGSVPLLPALDNTFGALLIGTFLGLMQYGWTVHQCYTYYRSTHKDTWMLEGTVAAVLVMETFHSILCMHAVYHYLVSDYFNPTAIAQSVWSISMLGVTTGATIVISQIFFLRRVFLIGRRFRLLVYLCALLLLTEFGLSLGVTIDTFLDSTLHNSNQAWMNSSGVGIAALADTLLTAALIFSLHQSRTGFKRTDGLIDILILYAINTGLLTGIFNMLSFAFAIAMPHNMIYVGIGIVATKLYANSLMAVLNTRDSLAAYKSGVLNTSIMDTHGHGVSEERKFFPVSGQTAITITTESMSINDSPLYEKATKKGDSDMV